MKQNDRFEQYISSALEELIETSESELKTKDELKADGVESHQFSVGFEKKMSRVCAKSRRKEWISKHKRVLYNTAAVLILVIGVSSITIAQVFASKNITFPFFLSVNETHAQILPDPNESIPVSEQFSKYYPSFIPENLVVVNVVEDDTGFAVSFQSEDEDTLTLSFYNKKMDIAFDSEGSNLEQFTIKGFPALVSYRADRTAVIWQGDKFTYNLSGTLGAEICVKILESVDLDL